MKVYLQVLYLIIHIIYTIDRWLILYIYNSHHTKITKAKAFDFKIGKQRNVKDLFSKKIRVDQQTHEKLFIITRNQENVNQNQNNIVFHICYYGNIKNNI